MCEFEVTFSEADLTTVGMCELCSLLAVAF